MTPAPARPQRMVEPETPSDFFPNLLIPPTPLSNQVGARWRLRKGRWVGFAQGRGGTGVMTAPRETLQTCRISFSLAAAMSSIFFVASSVIF